MIVVVIALIAIWSSRFWRQEQEQQKAPAMTLSAGHLEQPADGDPILHLKFWHVHRGSLKNGRLTVIVDYPGTARDERTHIHAFDIWKPNDENAVTWKVPLPSYQLDERVLVAIRLEAENARPFSYVQVWLGTDWVDDEIMISE